MTQSYNRIGLGGVVEACTTSGLYGLGGAATHWCEYEYIVSYLYGLCALERRSRCGGMALRAPRCVTMSERSACIYRLVSVSLQMMVYCVSCYY